MKYISILRGINVGGQKKIKMGDLKAVYESLGFQNVVTYIQSGNVIFDATRKNTTTLTTRIENAIQDKFKFHVPVEIRTHLEMADIIENCPFDSVNPDKKGTRVLVTFMSATPSNTRLADTLKHVVAPEILVIEGKVLYLYCPHGYGKSKLSNSFLEQKLGVVATTRNWNSVQKLYELSTE